MSTQIITKNVIGDTVVQLVDSNMEQIGRFHKECECETHGGSLHFTDFTGPDYCMVCVRVLVELETTNDI